MAAAALWLRLRRFAAPLLAVSVAFAYGMDGLAKLAEHRARR